MTRRRWIADQVSGDRAFLVGRNAEHLIRVLRARIGQQFEIATSDGVRMGEIVEIDPDRVVFATRRLPGLDSQENSRTIHLYLAIFKFDRFEWAVEKCTELGVNSIVPLIASRTDAHLASTAGKRVERWRRIAHQAAQQSRREAAPEIGEPEKLERPIATAAGRRIVLSENEREQRLRDVAGGAAEVSLAVGPEGGWTNSELDLFNKRGWSSASLGSTILRAETAAIAAIAIAQSLSS